METITNKSFKRINKNRKTYEYGYTYDLAANLKIFSCFIIHRYRNPLFRIGIAIIFFEDGLDFFKYEIDCINTMENENRRTHINIIDSTQIDQERFIGIILYMFGF